MALSIIKYHDSTNWLTWLDALSEDNYVIIDQFLDLTIYAEVKAYFLSKFQFFSQAGIGTQLQATICTDIRGDRIYWLEKEAVTTIPSFWGLIDETISMFNRYCFLSLASSEFHFSNYPPGTHYDAHVDQFQNSNNRIISIIMYLNDDWQTGDGGELEIFRGDNKTVSVEPIARRCVMFKSANILHRVLQCNKSRYSVTGWLLHRPSTLGQFFLRS